MSKQGLTNVEQKQDTAMRWFGEVGALTYEVVSGYAGAQEQPEGEGLWGP